MDLAAKRRSPGSRDRRLDGMNHQEAWLWCIARLGAPSQCERSTMRYGMNPHQAAAVVGDAGAVSVVAG